MQEMCIICYILYFYSNVFVYILLDMIRRDFGIDSTLNKYTDIPYDIVLQSI